MDRFVLFIPLISVPIIYLMGHSISVLWPASGTSGFQFLVWGFGVSTVVLYHCTFAINSLAHRKGSRRFETKDDSRNNLWLSLLTFGEGWHNNHHHYPGSARMGFRWWEVNMSYYLLRLLASVGLVWGLRPAPLRIREERVSSR